MLVQLWLHKYNNCHLLLNASFTQSGEFSYTKVEDVVTNSTDECLQLTPSVESIRYRAT
jgi:hypothetical protein